MVGAGASVGGASDSDDCEDAEVGDRAAEGFGRGEVLVGPLFTKLAISSGVLAGVTLSMNWKDGRRRTVVLWSE